jgi:hypothetical protein
MPLFVCNVVKAAALLLACLNMRAHLLLVLLLLSAFLLLLLLLLLQVCAYHEWNLDGLVEMCWEYLDLVSVVTVL